MQGRPLSCLERQMIEFRLKAHVSIRQIGHDLKRNHGVVSREIKRNQSRDGAYSSVVAQQKTDRRRHEQVHRKRKLDLNDDLRDHVIRELERGQSPDVIAGRLKFNSPSHLGGATISHEAIYQWIYAGQGRNIGLYPFLCSGRPRRQKHRTRKKRKTHIPGRISIHERPRYIEERREIGHWETDSMVFQKQRERLSVQYERKTRYMIIHRLSNGSAEETEQALTKSIESLPQPLFKTITFDNGGEGAYHMKLKRSFNLETYFCDPYASYQKGGVENVNKIIRRYLPRSINLSTFSDYALLQIQDRINRTPRKSLGYRTPLEVMAEACGQGVVH